MRKFTLLIIFSLITNIIFSQEELPSNKLIFDNLSEEEYISAPGISFDGNYLVFLVKNEESYKFYESKKTNKVWTEPIELTSITTFFGENTYKNSPVYNYDASKIYFEAQNGSNTDIYVSSRVSDSWSEPVLLSKNINTNKNEGEPSISPNDNILYFVRFENEKEPECGKIYVSKKDKNFEWSTPTPLIEPLNLECERTPRILSDNKTLIFSSIREGDKKFNLYYTKNLFVDIWILPIPLGTFSKNDNLYPAIDYKAEKIIFSSSNKNKKSELLFATLPSKFKPEKTFILTGKITNSEGKPIDGTISLLDPISTITHGIYQNNPETGEYFMFIPPKSNYVIDYSAKNYSHKFINYDNSKNENETDVINTQLFDKTTLYLNVFDKEIFEPFDVEIEILNAESGDILVVPHQKLDKGKYSITLPIGTKYKINLTSEFSEPYSLDIDLSGTVIFKTFEKNAEIISHKAQYTFQVVDSQNNSGIECDIILINKSTSKQIVSKAKTNANGEVAIFVRKGDVYDITINPHGYAFYNSTIEILDNENKSQKIELQPLKQDVKIELNNITFETNSAELNIESYDELNSVVDLMTQNPEIKVELSAHTDDIGSDAYNQKLSEKRAKSVLDYLIQHDVDKTKLISKGYGETQPLVENNSDENRAKNRRVELKIIEINP